MKFKSDSFKIRKTVYRNGQSFKFDNRRMTIQRFDTGFGLDFRIVDTDPVPHVVTEHLRSKVHVTRLKLSQESAEILMFSLAEQMGLCICERKDVND